MTMLSWYLKRYYGKSEDDPIFREIVEGRVPLDKYHVPHSKNCPALLADFRDGDSPCTCGLKALADAQPAKFLLIRAKWHVLLLLRTARAILRALLSINRRSWIEVRRDIEFEGHKYRSLRKALYWTPSKDQVTLRLPQDLLLRLGYGQDASQKTPSQTVRRRTLKA